MESNHRPYLATTWHFHSREETGETYTFPSEQEEAALSWFSPSDDVATVLNASINIFFEAARLLQKRIGFGHINGIALNGLSEEYELKTGRSLGLKIA